MTETRTAPVPLALLRKRTRPFDPIDELTRHRAERPITTTPLPNGRPAWLVTRYADVRRVLNDRRFSNADTPPTLLRPSATGIPERQAGNLLRMDPPQHTRLRQMLQGAFTNRRLSGMAGRIAETVTERLDAMAQAGPPADFLAEFALPVAQRVFCELLGAHDFDVKAYQRRDEALLDITLDEQRLTITYNEQEDALSDLVRRHRAEPRDGVLGMLIREHGAELSDAELNDICRALLIAGFDSMANMFALGTLVLLLHPDQLAMLRDDLSLVDRAVEEMLRYVSLVPNTLILTAAEDVLLDGQAIKAGDRLLVCLPTANRDEALCADPDRFDITRKPVPHVAFGYGIHQCLGQALARMEMRAVYPALLRRFPALRLAVPLDEVPFRTTGAIYGLYALPVAW